MDDMEVKTCKNCGLLLSAHNDQMLERCWEENSKKKQKALVEEFKRKGIV